MYTVKQGKCREKKRREITIRTEVEFISNVCEKALTSWGGSLF